jgi:predicted TIM-barrel fold metal-dependent hydrolase
MIIDVHYHQIPVLPDEIIEHVLSEPMRAVKVMGLDIDKATLIERAKETFADPEGDKLMAGMDEAGVDFTVICAVDNAENEVITRDLVVMQNQMVAEVAKKNPDRVMALAGVDPRREDAVAILGECFDELGMKGLKYHADYGFDPAGPESYKLLEIVAENNGVLLTHTGPLAPPARAKYAEPALLADIAVDFPDLKVIAAHMGYINWRPWAALAAHQPNLYGDLAMWDTIAIGRYELFCRELRDLLDFAGVNKVLFGTDDPVFRIIRPTREWIQLIKDLPEKAPAGIKFTEEEVNAILGGNAASLLGLSEKKS